MNELQLQGCCGRPFGEKKRREEWACSRGLSPSGRCDRTNYMVPLTEKVTSELPSTASGSLERISDPIQVAPGRGTFGNDWPIVSETAVTWQENGLTYTERTTLRRGLRPGMTPGAPSLGGRQAALNAIPCIYQGTDIVDRQHSVCGAGCITQYMRRTVDRYGGSAYNMFDRLEVRLWWTRQYSTQIDFSGSAYTQWNEDYAIDCNDNNVGRRVYSSFWPAWSTWDRTYDYVWDERWLPTAGPPAGSGLTLFVYTDTPTNVGPTLHTEIMLY